MSWTGTFRGLGGSGRHSKRLCPRPHPLPRLGLAPALPPVEPPFDRTLHDEARAEAARWCAGDDGGAEGSDDEEAA